MNLATRLAWRVGGAGPDKLHTAPASPELLPEKADIDVASEGGSSTRNRPGSIIELRQHLNSKQGRPPPTGAFGSACI